MASASWLKYSDSTKRYLRTRTCSSLLKLAHNRRVQEYNLGKMRELFGLLERELPKALKAASQPTNIQLPTLALTASCSCNLSCTAITSKPKKVLTKMSKEVGCRGRQRTR